MHIMAISGKYYIKKWLPNPLWFMAPIFRAVLPADPADPVVPVVPVVPVAPVARVVPAAPQAGRPLLLQSLRSR